MANLIVDEGNTLCKIGVMDSNKVLYEGSSAKFEFEMIEPLVEEFGIQRAIVTSTRNGGAAIAEQLRGIIDKVLHFTSTTPVPIEIEYASRETLGTDRIALAVGVICEERLRNALVIDLGSAITFDLIENRVFKGGNISPGVEMRFKALNKYTASLPMCHATGIKDGLGGSTEEAIEQGVMQGILYEIEGYMARLGAKNSKIITIFCGGGANYFVNRIKSAIFAPRKLMFTGLNKILEYNVSRGDI